MNMGRSSVGLTSCNGVLYCGGGFGGRVFLNSVECYTPYDDTWKVVAPLACPRSCLGGCGVLLADVSFLLLICKDKTA